MDRTFQRGDQKPYGSNYRICPETTEKVKNKIACFKTDGTKEAPVSQQSVLPDMTSFTVSLCIKITIGFYLFLLVYSLDQIRVNQRL